MLRADRAARIMSYVLLSAVAVDSLIHSDGNGGLIVEALVCLVCVAILAGMPRVREYFTGPYARHAGEDISVPAARTLLNFVGCGSILVGFGLLPGAPLGPGRALPGVVLMLVGVASFFVAKRLARTDPIERYIASGLLVLLGVFVLIGTNHNVVGQVIGTYTLLFAVGVLGLLWIPPDAQRHFRGRPAMAAGSPGTPMATGVPMPAGAGGPQYSAPAFAQAAPAPPFAQAAPAPPFAQAAPAPAFAQAPPSASASPAPAGQAAGYCGNCGAAHHAGDKFCMGCGQSL
jgi:hypothetical protein